MIVNYSEWYTEHESKLLNALAERTRDGQDPSYEILRYSHLKNYILSGEKMPEILIVHDDDGELSAPAVRLILDYFIDHPDVHLVYGDEDRRREDGTYTAPWMKPDWSPDTFLSTFYFGNVIALRSEALLLINPGLRRAEDIEIASARQQDRRDEELARTNEDDDPMREWIYGKVCLKLAQADGGFERRSRKAVAGGQFPIGHIQEVLFHASSKVSLWDGRLIRGSLTGRYSRESAATRLISIILPSRDNPAMLEDCARSIEAHTTVPHEIIIVDNGSGEENRRRVERLVEELNENGHAVYIYEPGPFNMAGFMNRGAREAGGEMLLFLHDHVEIHTDGWLSHLSEKAKLPYVGAVGIKLLYPDSDVIQHAGILMAGGVPVNRLRLKQNSESHHFDFNKGVRNVLAVSGACMMVRREVFAEAGGFDEERFPDCCSDIDFCLRLFELGYYNVVRNNMYLHYHEHGSIENEQTKEERLTRLPQERQTLRQLHPRLMREDPYYHKYFTTDPSEKRFRVDITDTDVR